MYDIRACHPCSRHNIFPLHYSSSRPLFSYFADGHLTLQVTESQQATQPILSWGLYCVVTQRHRKWSPVPRDIQNSRTLPQINFAVFGLLSTCIIILCGCHAIIYGLIWLFELDMESLTVLFRFLYVGFMQDRQRCLTEQCQNPEEGNVFRDGFELFAWICGTGLFNGIKILFCKPFRSLKMDFMLQITHW